MIIWTTVPGLQFHLIIWVRTILLSAVSLVINRYFYFGIAVLKQCQLFRYLLFYVSVHLSIQLLHCVFFIGSLPMLSKIVFGNVFWRFSLMVSRCIGIPAHEVFDIIAFVNMKQSAVNRIFLSCLCNIVQFFWRNRHCRCRHSVPQHPYFFC